jgi:hypothetical protein
MLPQGMDLESALSLFLLLAFEHIIEVVVQPGLKFVDGCLDTRTVQARRCIYQSPHEAREI